MNKHSGYSPDGRRLYPKGGDGGAEQMRADEQARQAKIQSAVDAINGKFGVGPAQAAPTQAQFTTAGTPGRAASPGGWVATSGGDAGEGYQGPAVEAVAATPGAFDSVGFKVAMDKWTADQGAGTGREAMYTDIGDATKKVATRDLDKQFTQASKQNLFGLARSGLLGGSVDAEAGGDLQQRYGEGKIRAEQAGVGAASDLKSVDEKTRQNLISLAQSGIDTGTASSLAAGQMAAAADSARANSGSATVGRLFDDLGQAYLQNTALRARYPNGLPAQSQGSMYGNLFNGKSYFGNVQN